ncbi:MAG: 30S ribosomal protein S6 [Clostridia bacterium]
MENKRLYESVLIFKGEFTEDEYKKSLNEIIEKIKDLINIKKVDEIGLKKLAYEVKQNKTGYYVVIYYKATSQAILEIERYFRITDDIIKFLTVRKED